MIIHTQKETFKNSNSSVDFHWYLGGSHLHTHYYYELFIIIDGEFDHEYRNKITKLQKGDVVLITPKNPHFLSTKQNNALHANFSITEGAFLDLTKNLSKETFEHLIKNSGIPTTLSQEQLSNIVQLINIPSTLEKNQEQKNIDFFYESIISIIISQMCFNKDNSTLNKNIPDWLKTFILKLQSPNVFCQPVSQIYELSGYSQSRLISLFSKYINKTPLQYVTELKINYAKNLLIKTNFSLLYISNELGFSSFSYFITLFKKFTGLTPLLFRKKYYI